MIKGQLWTAGELSLAKELLTRGLRYKEAALQLPGRTEKGLRRLASARGWSKKFLSARNGIGPVTSVQIDDAVLIDREKRANEPRTLTMMLMGDPPKSQSALFKRDAMVSLKVGEPLRANAPLSGS